MIERRGMFSNIDYKLVQAAAAQLRAMEWQLDKAFWLRDGLTCIEHPADTPDWLTSIPPDPPDTE